VHDLEADACPPEARHRRRVPDGRLFPHLSALENVASVCARAAFRAPSHARAREWLERVGPRCRATRAPRPLRRRGTRSRARARTARAFDEPSLDDATPTCARPAPSAEFLRPCARHARPRRHAYARRADLRWSQAPATRRPRDDDVRANRGCPARRLVLRSSGAARGARSPTVALDLPGHGADRTPPAQVTLDATRARASAIAAAEPVVLVGHSMGGVRSPPPRSASPSAYARSCT
jgi:hypothetical protein